MAPINEAENIATTPEILNEDVTMLPPKKSITTATPNPAPLLIPKTEGSAKGLRNIVWSNNPLNESAAPHNIAVSA